MQELENEIQGNGKPKEEEKVKSKSKSRKSKVKTPEVNERINIENKLNDKNTIEIKFENKISEIKATIQNKDEANSPVKYSEPSSSKKSPLRTTTSPLNRTKSPLPQKNSIFNDKKGKFNKQIYQDIGYDLPHAPVQEPLFYHTPYPQDIYNNQMVYGLSNPIGGFDYNNDYKRRQLSPLSIDTDILSTITMAPLSPRSAAFVLQNREIIERRKKSPKRSYSRSPSPRYGRSPRREFSPSPLRSPIRKRSLSPKRRSSPGESKSVKKIASKPSSPRRYSKSPSRRFSPKAVTIRDRLGAKLNTKLDENQKSPDNRVNSKVSENTEKNLDPILEARKRKFQCKEIKPEGIIRLKPSSKERIDEDINLLDEVNEHNLLEEEEMSTDDKNSSGEIKKDQSEPNCKLDPITSIESTEEELDETLLDDDVLDTKVEDLFSDEESDEENEGRFKSTSNENTRTVSVLPFTQLLNTKSQNLKTESLERKTERNDHVRDRKTRGNKHKKDFRPVKRHRSRSPLKCNDYNMTRDKIKECKNKIKLIDDKTEVREKPTNVKVKLAKESKKDRVATSIENKKIEIKIRNPSKYESETKRKESLEKNEDGKNIIKENKFFDDESEPEVVINGDEIIDDSLTNDGKNN